MSEFVEEIDTGRKDKLSIKMWAKVFKVAPKLRKPFLFLTLLGLTSIVADILMPLFQSYIVDNFIEANRTDGLIPFALMVLGVVMIQIVMLFFFFKACLLMELNVKSSMRRALFYKFQELPVSYFNNQPVGALVAKSMSDSDRIAETLSWGVLNIGWGIVYIAFSFIPMFFINWKLTLMVIGVLPIALILGMLFEKKLLVKNRKLRALNSDISAALNEGITGAKTIKTLHSEEKLLREFGGKTKKMCVETFRYSRFMSFYYSLLFFLGAVITAIILTYGGAKVPGDMTLGELTAFIGYTSFLVDPIIMLSEGIIGLVSNQANVERTMKILEEVPSVADTPEVIAKYGDCFYPKFGNWEAMEGDIEFRNVSFKYPDTDRYILKDFNLTIPKGTSLALVGETGAGKTTIVNLLCRFFEPTEGQILIDGRDYRERSLLWLERNLGYVLQTPHLFAGTIASNIRYGKPEATDEQMIAAAEMVAADKVVAKLKNSYQSEIGECGDTLSTGEKQLLTFARALLADPKIMILDEATSSIDTYTEYLIQQAVAKVLHGRTSIMIAHRLSTIKNADNILLIEEGKVQEACTHQELMKQRGRYFSLYTKLFEMERTEIYYKSALEQSEAAENN